MVVDSGWPEINGDPVSRAAASYDGALGALTATVLDKTVLGPSSWCWEVRGLHLQLLKRFRVRIVSKVVICRAHLVLMCAGCSGWSRNLDDATYNGISSGPPANKRENYIRDKTNNVQLNKTSKLYTVTLIQMGDTTLSALGTLCHVFKSIPSLSQRHHITNNNNYSLATLPYCSQV